MFIFTSFYFIQTEIIIKKKQ